MVASKTLEHFYLCLRYSIIYAKCLDKWIMFDKNIEAFCLQAAVKTSDELWLIKVLTLKFLTFERRDYVLSDFVDKTAGEIKRPKLLLETDLVCNMV